MWELILEVPSKKSVEFFERAIAEFVVGISSFEIKKSLAWQIKGYSPFLPDRGAIASRITVISILANVSEPKLQINCLKDINWVEESRKFSKPISIGHFFLPGFDATVRLPTNSTVVRIEPGMAFGTGSHETTQGCLKAIDHLFPSIGPDNPLDLGTGSGILAIALAKRYEGSVIASDNDNLAIQVACENAKKNGVLGQIKFYVTSGVENEAIRGNAPYDFLVANILARPLIELADKIVELLMPKSTVVLSGILTEQRKEVEKVYEKNGMKVINFIDSGEWVTLVLRFRNL